MLKPDIAIGWTTTASLEEAQTLARHLIEARIASCAQISAPIQSLYIWQGKQQCDTEYRVTVKFRPAHANRIEDWLQKHHSYTVPQWIWIYADGASAEYAQWIQEATAES